MNLRGRHLNSRGSQGKLATVKFSVGNDTFATRAVALPGESIDWTAVLSVVIRDVDQTTKMLNHIRGKSELTEAETHYLPPHMKEGKIQRAVLVSEGVVVEKVED